MPEKTWYWPFGCAGGRRGGQLQRSGQSVAPEQTMELTRGQESRPRRKGAAVSVALTAARQGGVAAARLECEAAERSLRAVVEHLPHHLFSVERPAT